MDSTKPSSDRKARESAPMKSRISSTDFFAAISSLVVEMSMP